MTYSWSALGPTTSSRPIPPSPYMSRIWAASVTQSDLGSFFLLFLFMPGFCLACQQGDTAHYYYSLYLPQPSYAWEQLVIGGESPFAFRKVSVFIL